MSSNEKRDCRRTRRVKLKIYYLKSTAILLAYLFAGTVAATIAGYLCGALVGLVMTFHNNNFLSDTSPPGGYLWWANLLGYIFAVFAVLPGAAIGFMVGLIKISEDGGLPTA